MNVPMFVMMFVKTVYQLLFVVVTKPHRSVASISPQPATLLPPHFY